MALTSGRAERSADICARVGRRIATLRQERGMSQQVLADLASVERSHLGKLELGEREAGLRILEKIADAMGVPVRELL